MVVVAAEINIHPQHTHKHAHNTNSGSAREQQRVCREFMDADDAHTTSVPTNSRYESWSTCPLDQTKWIVVILTCLLSS